MNRTTIITAKVLTEELTEASHIAHTGMASIIRVIIDHTNDLMTGITGDRELFSKSQNRFA